MSISFLAFHHVERKERTDAGKMRRVYKKAQTPLQRVLDSPEIPESIKAARRGGESGPERLRAQNPDRPATAGDRGPAPSGPHRGSDLTRARKQESDGTVRIDNDLYEVNLALRGLKVQLELDPWIKNPVLVRYKGQDFGTARKVDRHLNSQIEGGEARP